MSKRRCFARSMHYKENFFMTQKKRLGTQVFQLKPLAALFPLLMMSSQVGAVQTGQVAAGSGTINTSGTTTTINQQSDRLIVNWNNFDIADGQRVQINQPTSQSAILNRV